MLLSIKDSRWEASDQPAVDIQELRHHRPRGLGASLAGFVGRSGPADKNDVKTRFLNR